jgi:hypothetical protein
VAERKVSGELRRGADTAQALPVLRFGLNAAETKHTRVLSTHSLGIRLYPSRFFRMPPSEHFDVKRHQIQAM